MEHISCLNFSAVALGIRKICCAEDHNEGFLVLYVKCIFSGHFERFVVSLVSAHILGHYIAFVNKLYKNNFVCVCVCVCVCARIF